MTATSPVTAPPLAAPAGGKVPWQLKFAALSLIWGSSYLLMMIGLDSLEAVQIAWYRVLAGASVLVVLLTLTRGRLPRDRRTWRDVMVSGFFLCTLPFVLFAAAEERVSSALAGIGNATTPMASVLFSVLLLPGYRIAAGKLVAVVLGLLGVVVIMQPWQLEGRPDLLGFGMTLVAGASYGLGWTWVKRRLSDRDLGGLSLPTAQLLAATAQLTLVALCWWLFRLETHATPFALRPDAEGSAVPALLAVLALGVVGTGLAQILQYDVVRAAGPTVATTVTYLIPVVAVVLGVTFLDEVLSWPQLLGAGIVLAAAVVIGSPARRRGQRLSVR